MSTPILCAAIAAAAWLPAWRAAIGPRGCARSALLMSSRELPAPPAPPTLATRDYDGGDDGGLVLSSMTPETLQAVVSLWQWQQYAQQSGAADVEGRAVLHSLARWRGYNTTHGWGGLLRGQAFGAYVGGQVHGLVVVAYPRDISTVCRALVMKHAMYVENIAVAPAIPAFTALDLQSAITNTMIRRAACRWCHARRWRRSTTLGMHSLTLPRPPPRRLAELRGMRLTFDPTAFGVHGTDFFI